MRLGAVLAAQVEVAGFAIRADGSQEGGQIGGLDREDQRVVTEVRPQRLELRLDAVPQRVSRQRLRGRAAAGDDPRQEQSTLCRGTGY